ncbi:unnamed protein product [Heterobilharzia americana]|nr:unnamed protein product [Heterobilharzia americana]
MKNPVLGVEVTLETELQVESVSEQTDEFRDQIVEDNCDILSTYLADATKLTDREPVYNEDLGLAVERLPENYSIFDLWKLTPQRKKEK